MTAQYEIINHTADVALRAYGDSLEELFANAAAGMFRLMVTGANDAEPTWGSEIQVSGIDLETLLVGWLRELLIRFELHQEYCVHFKVDKIEPTHLKARVGAVRFNPAIHEHLRSVKAVTYHNLKIQQHNGRWQVAIVFDT